MPKKAAIQFVIIALVLMAVSVVVIQHEGRRTREAIDAAGVQVADALRDGIVDGVERSIDKAAEVPGKILRDAREVLLPGSAGTDAGRKAESPESSSPTEVVVPTKDDAHKTAELKTDVADTTPQPSAPTASDASRERLPSPHSKSTPKISRPADQPLTTSEFDPSQCLRDAIKLGQGLARAADDVGQEVVGLSIAEEIQLGKEVHLLVCRKHKVMNSSGMSKRLRELAEPMLKQRERKEVEYTFTVLASPEINAFAHAGGYVYLNQGILKFADNDAELQFVLAHEIAHVDLGQCRRGLTYSARAGELAGGNASALAQKAYVLIALGYSEDQEFDADEWAFRHMIIAGRSREESLLMPRHFARHFVNKAEKRSAKSPGAVVSEEIEKHLRSHPPSAERVRRLEELVLE